VQLKQDAKQGKIPKQGNRVDDDFRSTKIDLDGIRKNANESNKKFMRRVNRLTHQRRLEAGFAAKYNVDIERNQETGEIKLKKRPKDEINELMKKKRAEAKSGKKQFGNEDDNDKPAKDEAPKLTSLQKLKLKKQSKKLCKQDEKALAFEEYQHEEIRFGETAQAPPTLVTPRKAKKDETVPRPGKRDLLLTSMLKASDVNSPKDPFMKRTSSASTSSSSKKIPIKNGPIDKKGKRKNLPNSTRMALEAEQQNVIDLYRQLKKRQPIVLPAANKDLDDF